MNYATLKNSKRLRAVKRLWSRRWTSTRDTIFQTGYCAPNTIAAELRASGVPIETKRERGVFYYRVAA